MGSRFITDPVVRRLFQGIVLGGLIALVVLQFLFTFFVVGHHEGWISDTSGLESFTLALLEFPFDKDFASLAAVTAGVVPIVVATVCYRFDPDTKQSVDELNTTGRIAVSLLVGGIFLGLCAVAVAGMFAGDIALMVGKPVTDPVRIAMRNTLSAILGFQAFYCVQLVGLKK